MLDNLTQRLAHMVKAMRDRARLTKTNTTEMLCRVRLALLEADVALPVVREFIACVKERALGEDVITSLSSDQVLVGIVQRELTTIIGGQEVLGGVDSNIMDGRVAELNLSVTSPTIILMADPQGAGKTVTVGKFAKWFEGSKKKKMLTVSRDVYRPAVIAQLKTVSEQAGVDFFPPQPDQKPVDIATAALDWAKKHYHGVLTIDMTGHSGIGEVMMQEIAVLHAKLKPVKALLVIDAMPGQDAVNTVKAFNDTLFLIGVVLTKLDGDARNDMTLSVRRIMNKPIKFVDVVEKFGELEPFYPDRIAQWILGMGDIFALTEGAQCGVDMGEAQKLAAKIKKTDSFNPEDFKAQIDQVKKIGSLGSLMDELPAQLAQQARSTNMDQAEEQVRCMGGIINNMMAAECVKLELIKASRKRRVAAGVGVQVQEVNRLFNQFEQMQGMVKKSKGSDMTKMVRAIGGMKGGIKGLFGGR